MTEDMIKSALSMEGPLHSPPMPGFLESKVHSLKSGDSPQEVRGLDLLYSNTARFKFGEGEKIEVDGRLPDPVTGFIQTSPTSFVAVGVGYNSQTRDGGSPWYFLKAHSLDEDGDIAEEENVDEAESAGWYRNGNISSRPELISEAMLMIEDRVEKGNSVPTAEAWLIIKSIRVAFDEGISLEDAVAVAQLRA